MHHVLVLDKGEIKIVFDEMKLNLLSVQMRFGMMEMYIQYAHAHGKNKFVVIYDNDQKVLGSEKVVVMHGNDQIDRKSTRLNSSHSGESRMPSSA